jgi:tetratricopeptide (TPR) repeat protein
LAEIAVADLDRSARIEDVRDLLCRLDRISAEYEELAGTGIDLRPEQTRIDTVQRTVAAKGKMIHRVVARSGGWHRLRSQSEPPEDRWWWWLDHRVRAQRRKATRRAARLVLAAVCLLALAVAGYLRFLRPDPSVRLVYSYTLRAMSALEQAQYETALEWYQRALEISPQDPELNLMVGVVNEALGRVEQAGVYYDTAEALYGTGASFLTMRSQQYASLGWYEPGKADAEAAIALDPSMALPHCTLGTAYAGEGNVALAVGAFRQCADLARAAKQDALYVLATAQLAALLQ